jgi:protein-S-isoprenylcysteine O-methyltransferase Ste14
MALNFHISPTMAQIISVIITLSVVALFVAILVDFIKYDKNDVTKQNRRSIVATGSMVGFYIVYYFIVRLRIGSLDFINGYLIIIGTVAIVAGSAANIIARIQLKGNWANQIKIYEGHTLVNRGLYKIVRHPLYSSIIIMLFGGSVVFSNWLSAILTALVFVPFMCYRARQEEMLLLKEFAEYADYQKSTGMLFPRIWKTRSHK